jgi:hypothetical protein
MALGTNRDQHHGRKHAFVWRAPTKTLYSPTHTTPNQGQQKDVLRKVQPILLGHPIKIQQSTSTTLVFTQPQNARENFNLNKHKPVIMLKHVKYQPVPQDNLEVLAHCIIIIGITSKQWGARAGWCMT